MGEIAAKLESLFGEGRQEGLAGSYPGFRVAGKAPLEDVPGWDGQRGGGGTISGFGPARESTVMFDLSRV